MPTSANEQLIHAYLEIVKTDDHENFGTLLTDDCNFSPMPSGHTFRDRQPLTALNELCYGLRPETPPTRRQVESTAEVTPQHVAGNK
jgi:hypothetical protein